MRRLLIDWILSRWIDEGRPLPDRFGRASARSTRLRRHAAGIAEVDRALKRAASAQAAEPSPFLRGRILANLDSRTDRAMPHNRLAARLALSVACLGMLVAGAILMRGTPGPVVPPPDQGPRSPLANVFDDLRRYQHQILKASVDDRLKEEARNMVADTRRAADVVLTRFPFKAVASR